MTEYITSKIGSGTPEDPIRPDLSEITGNVKRYKVINETDTEFKIKAILGGKPSPDEAKTLILKQLKTWGWGRSKIRTIIKKYAVYEFMDGDNFEEAKLEIDDAEASDDITASEAQTLKDILDGKV